MRSLYESIFDIDDNIENVDRLKLIGDEWKINIEALRCYAWDDMLNEKILDYKPEINIYKSPKITSFDNKTNKVLEVLITIVLNCPLEWIEDRKLMYRSPELLYNVFERFVKKGYSHAGFNKMWGKPYFHMDGDKAVVKTMNRVEYPRIEIQLQYK